MKRLQSTPSTAGQFYDPGYEHLKSIYLLKNAQAKAPLQTASVYILPLMALQSARFAIEEYVNLTGRKIDPDWNKIDWQAKSVQTRIEHVYKNTKNSLCFESGIWEDVLALYKTGGLLEWDLTEMKKLQVEEIPENFKRIAMEYPIQRSQAIAEEAIDLLLEHSSVSSSLKRN